MVASKSKDEWGWPRGEARAAVIEPGHLVR